MGDSPIDYLIRLRILQAANLLRKEELNITEVAYRVGFQDSNYFARQFHRIMGTTPSIYRRQMLESV